VESGQDDVGEWLAYDYRQAPLSFEDRALCDFAAKLTLRPGAVHQDDFELLKAQRFTDEQVTVAVQVIGYFNYINRVADGLGVDPEDWMRPGPAEWRRRKAKWEAPRPL
jgi:uncharacterized peroxidase-related enzyme